MRFLRIDHVSFWWVFWLVMALEASVLIWLLCVVPSPPSGWIEVGNHTRLLYTDLPDGVRCYRRYYSSQLVCLQLIQSST